MKTGSANSKSFRLAPFRIDPSFHLSEGIAVRRQLVDLPYPLKTLRDASERIFIGNIFSRVFVKDDIHGIPYLQASDTVLANLDTGRFLSKKQAADLSYLMLKKDWVLITCSGTLGNVTYTNETFEGRIGTHDLIRVIPNDKTMLKGCLYAFLSSKYGYYQLTQSEFGGVVKHINADQAGEILVPELPIDFQRQVDALVQDAARLREKSYTSLKKAHSLFESHFVAPKEQSSCRRVSQATVWGSQLHRFEASYHISTGEYYDNYIKSNFVWKPLQDVTSRIFRPDIFKRMYVNDGITFLGGSDILLATPNSEKQLSRKSPNIEQFTIGEKWIILPRSGTIGDVVYTTSQHAHKLVSEHVIRIIPNDVLRGGYVFAVLSSRIGRALIQRPIFGSVILTIEPPLLSVIPIPVLEDKEMEEIAELAECYRVCWGRAAEEELKAIKMVEEEIEKWK